MQRITVELAPLTQAQAEQGAAQQVLGVSLAPLLQAVAQAQPAERVLTLDLVPALRGERGEPGPPGTNADAVELPDLTLIFDNKLV